MALEKSTHFKKIKEFFNVIRRRQNQFFILWVELYSGNFFIYEYVKKRINLRPSIFVLSFSFQGKYELTYFFIFLTKSAKLFSAFSWIYYT
jgi:hypothetical protein